MLFLGATSGGALAIVAVLTSLYPVATVLLARTMDDSLRLIAAGIPQDRLDAALSMDATDVAILNLGSLESPSDLRELHDRFPGARLLVLADNPSAFAPGRSSNAEIAAALHVGVETVRTHVRNIYRKLGVRSRRGLRSPG